MLIQHFRYTDCCIKIVFCHVRISISMSRFVFSFLMAPLCGTQVLWLMNNQEPFMVVCVLQQAACAVQGRRSRSGWGWVGGCCLISHSIETIWVTLIWGPLHTACWTLHTEYYCSLHTTHCTLYTLNTEHYTVHTMPFILHIALALSHWAQGKLQYVQYKICLCFSTMYSVHRTFLLCLCSRIYVNCFIVKYVRMYALLWIALSFSLQRIQQSLVQLRTI